MTTATKTSKKPMSQTSKEQENVIYGELAYPHLSQGTLVLNVAQLASVIAVDTETNARDCRDGRGFVRGVSVAFTVEGEGYSHYYPFRHAVGDNYDSHLLGLLKQVLEAAPALCFHNAKFDIVALQSLGIDVLNTWFFDTMIGAQLVNENQPIRKDLDSVALHYLGEHGKISEPALDKEKKTGFHNSTAAFVKEYAEKDAESTYRLGEVLLPKVYEEAGEGYWSHKQDLIRVLIAMERRGVKVNTELASELAGYGRTRLEQLKSDMGLNPGSKKDLQEAMIDRLGLPVVKETPKGAPSFDKFAMALYEPMLEKTNSPLASQLTEYRGWQKSVSSYYQAYIDLLSPDGRLRCNYRLDTTRTGRFSCTEPNLQQVPKVTDKPWNGRVKECLIPQDGYVLMEFDYSQLELRLGTAYAKERGLIEVFADPDRDFFTELSENLGWKRQDCKTFVYSVQYGGSKKRISDVFGVSQNEAQKMIDQYYRNYPGFKRITQQASMKAEANGKVRLWSGRYRHFINGAQEGYKALNSIIQGGSADVMEKVMVRLHKEVDHEDECRLLMQVHDAVTFEIREDLVDAYSERIISVMTDVDGATGMNWGVRFAVDGHRLESK
jgi:DNA polymerase-1